MHKKALIVDDSRLACKVMVKMLKSFGIQTYEAYSAEEALKALEQSHPDIIFLDHTMPGMDGRNFDHYDNYNDMNDTGELSQPPSLENTAFVGGNGILEFEKSFSKYIGVEHCITCANGTDSIEILLKAMDITNGDEVLVPAISWISTSEAVSSLGAFPVFVDIDNESLTIDCVDLKNKITQKYLSLYFIYSYLLFLFIFKAKTTLFFDNSIIQLFFDSRNDLFFFKKSASIK